MIKKLILLGFIMIFANTGFIMSQVTVLDTSQMNYKMAKMMGHDIFELNGVPYLQPTVEVMNITSNARFYNDAYVPKKVKKPYFKFGVHGMYGFVPDNKKTYSPVLPTDSLTLDKVLKYGSVDIVNRTLAINDTAGLIYQVLKGMLFNGIKDGSIEVPSSAPTALGSGKQSFNLPKEVLQKLFDDLSIDVPFFGNILDSLPQPLRDSISNIFGSFPGFFNLPEGANLSTFFAFVPQLEVGSLFGTELLVRFIPPVDMGKDIGKFAFWGVGLKHSISQYFNKSEEVNERLFDMAFQIVYQGTSLENRIGVTNADLKANATMWNVNMHASKSFEGLFDVYTGLSYESIAIKSDYKYYLPIEMQWQLGLTSQTNGDPAPQTATIELTDSAIKWTLGLSRAFGPVTVFADFNISTLMMFSGGIVYKF